MGGAATAACCEIAKRDFRETDYLRVLTRIRPEPCSFLMKGLLFLAVRMLGSSTDPLLLSLIYECRV